jgi:hypothetical protein
MSAFQRELFRLPRPKREPMSAKQRTLLTWLLLGDGQLPAVFHRGVLRSLLRKRWVERSGSSPARYQVTAYGQAARSRGQVSRETSDESAADAGV